MRNRTAGAIGAVVGGSVVAAAVGVGVLTGAGPFCRPLDEQRVLAVMDEAQREPRPPVSDEEFGAALDLVTRLDERACLSWLERRDTLTALAIVSAPWDSPATTTDGAADTVTDDAGTDDVGVADGGADDAVVDGLD